MIALYESIAEIALIGYRTDGREGGTKIQVKFILHFSGSLDHFFILSLSARQNLADANVLFL